MSELRLFDPEIERDIEFAPTRGVSTDTHMKPDTAINPDNNPDINPDSSRPATERPFEVEVVRSTRRRRTISAQMHDGVGRARGAARRGRGGDRRAAGGDAA